jgi:hypothetical protein
MVKPTRTRNNPATGGRYRAERFVDLALVPELMQLSVEIGEEPYEFWERYRLNHDFPRVMPQRLTIAISF